ncbi:universal stress protein [Paramaledivibacter caminithermalis]|uniref:Nucleotide-binding universal stress protein, UspA family n=1 Tax=Paramaledivibacter caminithermalis (strain DSM 15212 / CIP 107654 / DViRD3) TaxID=1121301 RepID=A0A1M6LFF5_PARC5|nr:universal stress protein [Paramaledivibacter caminithermalis]SHJ69934.1 Nucleotide-binding universal stress protein, UspA family [Paramaledivibacter caminithermalis DSM 15212]
MKKIFLLIDGSEICPKAYEHAKKIAEKFDSQIIIFNAQDLTPPFGWLYNPVILKNEKSNPQKIAKRIVEDEKKSFNGTGIKVTTETALGDPAVTILETVEKKDCDLIIMFTHGMSRSKRFLIGSVTNKMVLHSKIPVLVIR